MKQPNRQSFERTYGWAWALKLAEELHSWNDGDGKKWSENLQPLAEALTKSYLNFLPKQTYPIRTGVHSSTAFAIARCPPALPTSVTPLSCGSGSG